MKSSHVFFSVNTLEFTMLNTAEEPLHFHYTGKLVGSALVHKFLP